MDKHLEIHGTITEHQYVQMVMEAQKNQFVFWFAWTFFFTLLLFAFFTSSLNITLVLLSCVAVALVSTWILHQRAKKVLRLEYRSSTYLQQEQTFVIHEQGIDQYVPNGHTSWTWKDIYGFKEDYYHFRLYLSTKGYFLLPKHFFLSTNDIQRFRTMIRE